MGLIWLAVAQNLNNKSKPYKQAKAQPGKKQGNSPTRQYRRIVISSSDPDDEEPQQSFDSPTRNQLFAYPKQNEYVWYNDKLYLKEEAQKLMYYNRKQEQVVRINQILAYLAKYGIDSQQMHDYLLSLDDVELDNFMEQMKKSQSDPNFLKQYRQYQRLKSIVEVMEEEDELDEEQFDKLCNISDEADGGQSVECKLRQIQQIPIQLKQDVTNKNSQTFIKQRSQTQPCINFESQKHPISEIQGVSRSMNDIQTTQNNMPYEFLLRIEENKISFSNKQKEFQSMFNEKDNMLHFQFFDQQSPENKLQPIQTV